MKNFDDIKDDSVNFFEVFKDGKKINDQEEKSEIENNMFSLLLYSLRKILDGTYVVEELPLTLTINDVKTDYIFTVRQKDTLMGVKGSPFNELQTLKFEESNPQDLQLLNNFFDQIDYYIQNQKSSEDNSKCTDLRFMVGHLLDLVDQKVMQIQMCQLNDMTSTLKSQNNLIKSYCANAIGCLEVCKFCNRKCELGPHQDDTQNHNCDKRGHSLRVFGGGTHLASWGDVFPSLTTCDQIKHETKIRINQKDRWEEKYWSEIHDSINQKWTTNYIQFLHNLNKDWLKMSSNLEQFWQLHGQKYCDEKNYKFIDFKASKMKGSAIVIICLDESLSMFNKNKDFEKAVSGGKELEQYLKANHLNPEKVQIQLWFNDCQGVNRVYKGKLIDTIPNYSWIRTGCQGDTELMEPQNVNVNYGMCGQFTGAVRILNKEIDRQLFSKQFDNVYWFFFTDGKHDYPEKELRNLEKVLKQNLQNWTFQGKNKLQPQIITNQVSIESLVKMKQKIDQIINDIWQVNDACSLKQNVKTENLAETMIEQFTFTD